MEGLRGVCLLLLLPLVAHGADKIVPVADGDPEINAAILRSRQTLDTFLKLRMASPGDAGGFTVKVLFSESGHREHMWVAPFRATAAGFEGILKSQPRFISGLRYGQQVQFSRDQITDWGYNKNGTLFGYRTVCVFLARDPGQREQARRDGLVYECAP